MVGSMGAVATTSVSISQSPNMLVNGVVMALGVGFTSMIARSVGAGELERARILVRQAIMMVFALGLPMSAIYFMLGKQIPIWMGGEPEILDTAEMHTSAFLCQAPCRTGRLIRTPSAIEPIGIPRR